MKKFLLALGLIALLIVPAYAQWSSGETRGPTYKHKNAQRDADGWWASGGNGTTTESISFGKYTKVRADYDTGGTTFVTANVNLMCSNDSIWMSGSSIAITGDCYRTYNLLGCKDYAFYLESIEGTAPTMTIYLTPYLGEYNGE